MRKYGNTAPQLVPVDTDEGQPTAGHSEPAFRKFTPAVRRGVQYLVAAGEFDARHELMDLNGLTVQLGTTNDDLRAAVLWLRDQLSKRDTP